jgi:hypothetical protein
MNNSTVSAHAEKRHCLKPKAKRRPQMSRRHLRQCWPETVNGDGSPQAEENDKLLLSSLHYWEVERDLIEERVAQLGR